MVQEGGPGTGLIQPESPAEKAMLFVSGLKSSQIVSRLNTTAVPPRGLGAFCLLVSSDLPLHLVQLLSVTLGSDLN